MRLSHHSLTVTGLAILALLFMTGGCAKKPAPAETREVMGTKVTLTVYDEGMKGSDLKPIFDETFALLENWGQKAVLPGPDNQVAGLSKGAGQQSIATEQAVFDMLMKALRLYDASGQVFDIRYGPMIDLWGFDAKPHVPATTDLDTAKTLVGNGSMFVAGNSILLGKKGMRFDAREIAVGYGLDLAAAKLAEKGIRTATVCTPTVCRTMGDAPDKRGFEIKFPDPVKGDGEWATVWAPVGGLAYAAAFKGRFEADGKSYHSLIDPRTGMPANKYRAALVQSPDAATAQAMAYALFVTGGEGFDKDGHAAVAGSVLVASDGGKTVEAGTLAGNFATR